MKKYIFLIFATFMFPIFGLASSNDISILDSLINKKSQIIEQKLSNIKIITNMLNTEGLTDAERYAINDRLYNEYGFIVSYNKYTFYLLQDYLRKPTCYFKSWLPRLKITENNAMRELSSMLLNENDIERANKYLNISVNDAAFYGTRLRNIQASQLLPQIERAYKAYAAIKDRNKQILLISVTIIAFLLLVAIGICVFSLKKYRVANEKVQIANKELNKLVEQLKVLNGQMAENNHLKEQYISRFLQLASQFIDMSNERQKNLNRLARDHKLPELYAELKGQSYIQLLESMFYQNFDSAFLNIYPNFIAEVNKLLLPEMAIEQKNDKKMTTELRILALIRLGITDNNSISRILNASMTTIYTYRSKLKGRALDKNTFEEKVKLIDVSYPLTNK